MENLCLSNDIFRLLQVKTISLLLHNTLVFKLVQQGERALGQRFAVPRFRVAPTAGYLVCTFIESGLGGNILTTGRAF